jgi:hypothetical protein
MSSIALIFFNERDCEQFQVGVFNQVFLSKFIEMTIGAKHPVYASTHIRATEKKM